MSILDKKLFLSNFEDRLNSFIPANDVRRIIDQAAEALVSYEMTATPQEGSETDDSSSLLKLFLDAKQLQGCSKNTIERYRYIITRLRKDTGVQLTQMTVSHLRKWLNQNSENPGAKEIAASTKKGNQYVLTSFFGWAWREELIEKNPAQKLAPIKEQKVIRKTFSEVEIEKMKDAAEEPRDLAIITFLLSTGCRVSEVCSLDVLDVDFYDKCAKVLGKGNKERIVYLDDICLMYLDMYLRERDDSEEALFIGRGSKRLQPHGVRAMLKRIEKASGVENVHPHRFRRTLATNLIDNGMPIHEVATILGHENIDTTMTYIYVDQKKVENSYRKYA